MLWNLNVDNFTLFDRLRVAGFILNKRNRLTMGKHVEQIEYEFGKLSDSFTLFVSSGSTANSLLAETLKQMYGNDTTVILPTTTWSTSVNPWIQAGYRIRFSDVNMTDFSFDLDKLKEVLVDEYTNGRKSIVFATALIGFVPDIDALKTLCEKYGAVFMMDNCENTLGTYKGKSILSYTTNTTSTYFGHQLCSVEGGFLMTKDHTLYRTAKMVRNHGLTRALTGGRLQTIGGSAWEAREKLEWETEFSHIDPQFLFAWVGNNFRNTEINALFGLLDLKRKDKYAAHRRAIYSYFHQQISHDEYYVPSIEATDREHVPFCLPLIAESKELLSKLKGALSRAQIEYRPIVGGNLLVQPIYSKYAEGVDNQNSQILHERGLYVGLHQKVSYSDINNLVELANNL